ncbi:short-chain dehydrogenase reductase 3b-like [Vigna angularis]|uniref:short-chain dehydrogenase reductase 3b-like n=1 Tax=Phaseolus angularis TaxID=3914 RepID=UPI00080A503B|nr:short-chain dehydrogenase reductase 3b-like [Vigna angularis]
MAKLKRELGIWKPAAFFIHLEMALLQGKVAIVTSGATRIGVEVVRIFVENGAFVVIVDIKDQLGHSLTTSFGSDKVSYRHYDVRDENEVAETMAFTIEKYNCLDIMFSNASIA